MSRAILHTVNLGAGSGGLSTVGYTLYNLNGTVHSSRSTTGVFEVGTSTGIYAANIQMPDDEQLLVLWDSGAAIPVYGIEDYRTQLNDIQNGTDRINMIWNSIRNQGEYFTKVIDKIGMLPTREEYLPEIKKTVDVLPRSGEFKKIKDVIEEYEKRRLADKAEILGMIKADKVINIPDTMKDIPKMAELLRAVTEGRDPQFRTLIAAFDNAVKRLEQTAAQSISAIVAQLQSLHQYLLKIEDLDQNGKEMIKIKQGIDASIQKLTGAMKNKNMTPEQRNLLLTFSHRRGK